MDVAMKQAKKPFNSNNSNDNSNNNAINNESRWKVWPIVRNNYQEVALKAHQKCDVDKAILYDSKALSCGFVKKLINAEQLNQAIDGSTISETVHLQQKTGNELIDYLASCISGTTFVEKKCSEPAIDKDDQMEFNELREKCAKLPKQWNVIQLNQVSNGYNGYATTKDLYTSDAPVKITLFRHSLSDKTDSQPISIILDLKEYGTKNVRNAIS